MRIHNFNYREAAKVAGLGAGAGSLWGLGYGVARPLLDGEPIDPEYIGKEIVANAAGGAMSATGVHYGGKLLKNTWNKYMSKPNGVILK